MARGSAALGGAGRMGIERGEEPPLGNTCTGRAQDQTLAHLRERNRRHGQRPYLSRRLHELGPKAAAEFLDEINRHHDLDDDLNRRLEAYVTRLKPGLFIITGVIYPITELYDVPLVVFRGFSSETFTFEAVEAREKDSRPYWVYYLGEFDPSGHDAARTLQGKLERFANEKGVRIIFAQLTVTERFTVGNRRRPSRTGRPQPTRTALTMLPASWTRSRKLRIALRCALPAHGRRSSASQTAPSTRAGDEATDRRRTAPRGECQLGALASCQRRAPTDERCRLGTARQRHLSRIRVRRVADRAERAKHVERAEGV